MEIREAKRKIQSVQNIFELTAALETLSALKMKKAQKTALLSRPFAQATARILRQLEPSLETAESIFLKEREVQKILVCVIASDRGFAGSFNQNILAAAEKEIEALKQREKAEIEVLPVGKKAVKFFKKQGYPVKWQYFGIGDIVEIEEAKSISDFLIRAFKENKFQKVYLFYTDFISTFSQKPKKIQLLPFKRDSLEEFLKQAEEKPAKQELDFLIEPSRDFLFDEILPQLAEYLIYQCILEANASEHSARMMAMRSASENAQKKTQELKLIYNKARQEQITSEVCEISSAKEVLS